MLAETPGEHGAPQLLWDGKCSPSVASLPAVDMGPSEVQGLGMTGGWIITEGLHWS